MLKSIRFNMQTMIRFSVLVYGFFLAGTAYAQDSLTTKKDSVKLLSEVVVHGYANDRPLLEVPAAIGYVDTRALERFNNTSLLPAVNTIPGVRMEERSPGSYRFAIRGSSLRSPFGVRNVKMYWNGLPLTDGGGNTYINLVDFNSVAKAEIIKGPGGSLYGAGTGGVVLLGSPLSNHNQLQVSALGGSYGLQRYQVSAQTGSQKVRAAINYAHQVATGYREQTSMRRDAVNTDLQFALSKSSVLSASIFYTDLYYQTPGGLTQAQFDADPRQARPPKKTPPTLPGAAEQQTAVYNKTFFAGLMYDYQWNDRWSTRVGAYGSLTDFTNPTINNYEKRKENNWGGRTETQYGFGKSAWKGKLTFGGEFQHFYSPLADYVNTLGVQGIVQTDDRLSSTFALLFAQAEIDLPKDFYLTLGGSGNFLKYTFNRLVPPPSIAQERSFDPVFSPRIALLKKVNDRFSVYGSISKGFSPPSLAEVRPSTGNYNNGLNPEKGISYEVGFRGNLSHAFSWDIAAYDFELDETIVVQQLNNADYFINAGRTSQKGLEALLSWSPNLQNHQFLNSLKLWSSYTFNDYRFKDYVKNGQDFSGHKLTGVPPNMVAGGVDAQLARKIYVNVTLNFVDKIPLNDANSQYSEPYILAGTRIGFRSTLHKKLAMDLFAGVDNATNKRYSLGNDLNAAANRYFNAAAGRNYYAGLKVSF